MHYDAAIFERDTYLSTTVKQILVDSRGNLTCSNHSNNFITKCFTFDWSSISLNLITEEDFEVLCIPTASQKVWKVFTACGHQLQNLEDENLPVHYWMWTNCVEEIKTCALELRYSLGTISALKATLILSSIFENALGNVYQLKKTPVPFLLRDLLVSEELCSIFDKFPMIMARVLLGTPLGFNLRNVCWHGFPAPSEINVDVAASLIALITSFGEILYGAKIISLPSRPKMDAISWSAFVPHLCCNSFPDLSLHSQEVMSIIQTSNFVPNTHRDYWISAFQFLCSKQYGESLVLLLPALEHTLRCLFCSVNNCPSRVLVAEQNTLYTTMDEILDQYQTDFDERQVENCLPSLVGCKVMEMLMDMLNSFGGPRLRDKLSHGECHLSQIPGVVANHMFCVAILVLLKVNSTSTHIFSAKLEEAEINFCPKFHCTSLLKSQIRAIREKLLELSSERSNDSVQADVLEFKLVLLNLASKFTLESNENIFYHIDYLLEKSVTTLYRSKSDVSIIGMLRKVALSVDQACLNCLSALQDRQHSQSLRSRQRTSLARLLEFVPTFQVMLNCVIVIILIQLHCLPNSFVRSSFLKSVLHYSESIASLSSQEKNRWVEIKEKTTKFCEQNMIICKETNL